jgi:phenolic acid decarboxylase
MKKLLMSAIVVASLLAAVWPARAADLQAKLLGTWKMEVVSGDTTLDYELRFAKADGKLEATLVSPRSGDHKYKSVVCRENDFEMVLERERDGDTVTYIYKGKLTADGLSGTMVTKGQEDQSAQTWKATKAAEAGAGLQAKLLGTWKMEVVSGDNTTDYELRFAKVDDKLEATLISPRSGDHKYKSVVCRENDFEMVLDRERDGDTVTYIYKGKLTADGLSGTMVTKGQEDQSALTWKATKAADGAGLQAKLLGTWKMEVVSGDNTTDYELRFAKVDGKLEATLVSPRSGDHKYKSVVCRENDFEMVLDRERDGDTVTYIYKGKLTADGLSGTMVTKGQEDQSALTWKATKQN